MGIKMSANCNVENDRRRKNLRKLRIERGLTQKSLGEKAGIPNTSVAKLENGESLFENTAAKTLMSIAHALDVTVDELL